MKIRPVGSRVRPCERTDGRTDGQTDRHTDMTQLTVAFRNFANASKKRTKEIT
jgi:hypothetical protein